MPAGKIDLQETPLRCATRELQEETQILASSDDFIFINKLYSKYPDFDFEIFVYRLNLTTTPPVTISSTEHQTCVWVAPTEAHKLDLMPDLGECLQKYCGL